MRAQERNHIFVFRELQRCPLLALNHERYAEEVKAGLHDKKKSKGKGAKRAGKKSKGTKAKGSGEQGSLF